MYKSSQTLCNVFERVSMRMMQTTGRFIAAQLEDICNHTKLVISNSSQAGGDCCHQKNEWLAGVCPETGTMSF